VENIGARRLQTVLEKVVEDISFTASDRSGEKVVIDADDVRRLELQVQGVLDKLDGRVREPSHAGSFRQVQRAGTPVLRPRKIVAFGRTRYFPSADVSCPIPEHRRR